MTLKQVRALFSGTVQGVGFRYTARNLSRNFTVTGYVRNLTDGSVELIAEGDEQELKDFVEAITRSHLGAMIRETRIVWEAPENRFESFEIAV